MLHLQNINDILIYSRINECSNLSPRMLKYNPGTRNVTSCVIFRPPWSWDEEEEVTSEQVTHLGFRSLGSIARGEMCRNLLSRNIIEHALVKTNLKLFSSCQSLTQLCCAALYVMDWLSRVCLCHRQPIRLLHRGDLTNQRTGKCSAEVAGSQRPQADLRNTRHCPHPSSSYSVITH